MKQRKAEYRLAGVRGMGGGGGVGVRIVALSISSHEQTHKNRVSYFLILLVLQYVLKRLSLGSKDCTKELKPECAYFLGQTS